MQRLAVFLPSIAAFAGPAAARAETWEIDPAHTRVGFAVKHMMVTDVHGSFKDVAGTIEWDAQKPEATKIDAKIGAASIDTGVDKRDGHLRSADFFDAEKHPHITFKARSVRRTDKNSLEAAGDLTMHGVTREVKLAVVGPSGAWKDPGGRIRAGASASTTINREDFGLKWNVPLDGGGVLVGKEVRIQLDLGLMRK